MGGTKLAGSLDRGGTIYDGLAGTYLGQRLLSAARARACRVFQDTARHVASRVT